MVTEMGKHTAPIRDHLGQRSSSVPQPLAPRDVHPVILAANSREEAFPEVFADNPTSRQMFQTAPGALDQGCRVLGAVLPLLVGQAPPGCAPRGHSHGAAWQAARLCGDGPQGDVSGAQ